MNTYPNLSEIELQEKNVDILDFMALSAFAYMFFCMGRKYEKDHKKKEVIASTKGYDFFFFLDEL